MAVDFPSSPTVGQTFTSGGVTWMWDGVKWTSTSAAVGLYLPITGGTMQGDLILNRDAQVALGAATLEQVQARGSGSNRIINGDMRINQYNGGSGTAINVFAVDRWMYPSTQAGKGTWTQSGAGPALIQLGFGNNLSFTSSSSYTPLAADIFNFQQVIEADMISDFAWGTPNAQPVTLSFIVWASVAGAYSGAISNAKAGTRSYPFSYTLSASTWTKIVITIPGDTAGTWTMSGNGIGAVMRFDLGTGATFRAPAGAWTSGDYRGANGTISTVATNGASLQVTGVKLEIGSIATPFNRKSPQESMADCQRYYWQPDSNFLANGYNAAGGFVYNQYSFPVAMRAAPSIAFSGQAYNNSSALTAATIGTSIFRTLLTITAVGLGYVNATATFSAEL